MNQKRTFSELISKSPFGPIQVHMGKSKECAKELLVFLDAATDNDWDKATISRKQIIQLEKDADELKAEREIEYQNECFCLHICNKRPGREARALNHPSGQAVKLRH